MLLLSLFPLTPSLLSFSSSVSPYQASSSSFHHLYHHHPHLLITISRRYSPADISHKSSQSLPSAGPRGIPVSIPSHCRGQTPLTKISPLSISTSPRDNLVRDATPVQRTVDSVVLGSLWSFEGHLNRTAVCTKRIGGVGSLGHFSTSRTT